MSDLKKQLAYAEEYFQEKSLTKQKFMEQFNGLGSGELELGDLGLILKIGWLRF